MPSWSVRDSASQLVADSVKQRCQVVGGDLGEVERLPLDRPGGGEPGEAKCLVMLNVQSIGHGKHIRGLRRAWLPRPVVDRVSVHLAALGKPRFGLALLVEGRLDQVEELACGGLFAHTSQCAEMTRAVTSVSLPICAQSRIELPRDAQRKEGVGDVYISTAQACGRLNISRDTLAKRIREGELDAIKGTARNSHVKVSLPSIEAYEERRRIAADEESAA